MKLKTIGLWFAVALVTAGISVATALILITDFLHEATDSLGDAIDSVYIAEELEVAMLLHNRSAFLFSITQDPQEKEATRTLEEDIYRHLESLRARASWPGEVEKIAEAKAAIEIYLQTRGQVYDLERPPLDVYREASQPLVNSYRLVEDIVEINLENARQRQSQAEYENKVADLIGYPSVVLLLVLVVLVLVIGKKSVLLPLQQLQHAARRFGQGNLRERITPIGVGEIRETSNLFNEMADNIVRRREERLQFVATLAHDLKNPLSAIRMGAQLLHDAELSQQDRETVEIIVRQTGVLERVLGDLLDSARMDSESFTMNFARADLAMLVRESVQLFRGASGEHQIELDIPENPVWVKCDSQRINQVLNNLLSNAIKYSPGGGRIWINLFEEKGSATVEVRDEGIGIPAEETEKIFQEFHRSSLSRNKIPGVGLGLASARKIVEAHGGRISAKPQPKGSLFKFTLPIH